jgi:predicted site-specific integrase-resolvase
MHYSTKDVASLLKVDVKTVQNYLKKGLLPYSHRLPSGVYRFGEEEMNQIKAMYFMKGHETTDGNQN